MPLDAPPDESLNLTSLETAFAAALAQDGEGDSDGDGAAQSAFVAAIWDDYRPGELPGVSAGDLGAVLARFWRFGAALKGESPTVRLSRATGAGGRDLGLDVLEIVQPDAPFLVDSVMGEVGESGADVLAMFHPRGGRGAGAGALDDPGLADARGRGAARRTDRAGPAPPWPTCAPAVGDFSRHAGPDGRGHRRSGPGRARPRQTSSIRKPWRRTSPSCGWMDAGHFVFLGARRLRLSPGRGRRLCGRGADVRARRRAWACCAIPSRLVLRRGQRAGGAGSAAALAPGGRPSRWWWPSRT